MTPLARIQAILLDAPPASSSAPAPPDTARELARLAARRARAVDAFTAGDITREDMRAAVGRIEAEEGEVRRRAEEAREAVERLARASDPRRRASLLGHVATLRKAWARLPVEGRRAIVLELARRVTVGRAGVAIEWKTAADLAIDDASPIGQR